MPTEDHVVTTDFLSPTEASKKYNISEKTLRKRIDEGKLPAVRSGRMIRIDPRVMEAYIKARG